MKNFLGTLAVILMLFTPSIYLLIRILPEIVQLEKRIDILEQK